MMASMEKKRVKLVALSPEDIDALRSAIAYTLENEVKVGQHTKRVRLYGLRRRLYRARLDLEK